MFLKEHISLRICTYNIISIIKFTLVMSLGVKINFNLPADENAETSGGVVAPSHRFCGMIRVDGQETAQF